MAPVTSSPNRKEDRPRSRANTWKLVIVLGLVVVATGVFVVHCYWPFKQAIVIQDLEEASDSKIQVRSFQRMYFPYPGCVLEGVVFLHGSVAQPLITIERLTIQSTYIRVLSRHVNSINAEAMQVFIPAAGTRQAFHTKPSTITVGEIVADGSVVEFASGEPNKAPLRFDIHSASLRDVGWGGPLNYRITVRNPEPPGEVTASGQFGVWSERDPAQTPISGEYKFEKADLGVYGGIAGTLSSTGKFAGRLGHLNISGTTDMPDFEVKHGRHPVRLVTAFDAYVNGMNGDTFLNRVDANFGKTHIVARGSIAKTENGKGKTAQFHLTSDAGRIEDILGLFVKAPRSPMSGPLKAQASVTIPPGNHPFLEKVRLLGTFGIGGAEFSKQSTQEDVNKLSANACGEKNSEDPETILTDLKGKVTLEGGVATFADMSFDVPGAAARMHGTYDVINHKVDLHGQMHVLTKISNITSGAKALLLKIMDPFFKKRKKGEILPVRISGTYEKPSFGLDLNDKKAQTPPPPNATTRAK
jgi:AsmA-like C-terminal region